MLPSELCIFCNSTDQKCIYMLLSMEWQFQRILDFIKQVSSSHGCQDTLQCNHLHVYLKANSNELNEAYAQVSLYKIAALNVWGQCLPKPQISEQLLNNISAVVIGLQLQKQNKFCKIWKNAHVCIVCKIDGEHRIWLFFVLNFSLLEMRSVHSSE